MKREILFRGKRTDNGEWIYGDLRHISDGHGGYILCIVDNTNGRNNDVTGVEVVPETVGQFTGLTDKNGKKIYEGDIVKAFDCIYVIYVVMWDSVRAMFYLRDHISRVMSDFYNYFGSNLVVIGNIHDNPSLLNVAAKDIASDADAGGLAPATAENFELMRG